MVRGSTVNRLRPVGSTSRAAARRRPRRARRDVAAVERGEQRRPLGRRAGRAASGSLARAARPIDMQPVLDGEILEVAEPGVDAAQRLVGRVALGDAGFGGKAGLLRAVSTISRASRSRRRRSSPSAWAYSSTSRSSSCCSSSSPAPTSGGGRWPSVTAAIRRLACAASPGLETMKG